MGRLKFKYTLSKTSLKKLYGKMSGLRKPITKEAAAEAGKEAVSKIKEQIAKGTSPIKGHGKFKAYKGQYRKRIQRYGRVNGYPKALQPVNLKLSGDFWSKLRSKVSKGIAGYTVDIGFFDKKSKAKEKGHRTEWNGQGFRPIIPAKGEEFAKPVANAYLKVFERTINELLKKKT